MSEYDKRFHNQEPPLDNNPGLIRRKIVLALLNAKGAHLTADEKATKKSVLDAELNGTRVRREVGILLEGGKEEEDIIVNFIDTPPDLNEIMTGNTDEYPLLIREACKMIGVKEDMLEDVVEKHVKHEMEHARPGLGIDGLSIYYCVRFLRTEKGSAIQPFLILRGKCPFSVYKEILAGPGIENLSTTDQIYLNFINK